MARYYHENAEGAGFAYGFDYVVGPFVECYDAEGDTTLSIDNFTDHTFDCHALAAFLHTLVARGHLPDDYVVQDHILTLTLDLPI